MKANSTPNFSAKLKLCITWQPVIDDYFHS